MGQMFPPSHYKMTGSFLLFLILISIMHVKQHILNSQPVISLLIFVFPPIENFTSICQISNCGEFIIIAKETILYFNLWHNIRNTKNHLYGKRKFLM